jgi:dienelactone hydrolase
MRSTSEHTAVGIGSILVGRNTASYRIWDGMRAIDFLQSRPEIDAAKIGCTGISGGGTLTEYLMALDDRIVAAAPGCAINTFASRVRKGGIGDAEQDIFGQIGFGLDHADYVHMRAPKPTLLLCATQDFVDIEGSWEIFREAKRIYARFGYSERIDLLEADEKHGFPQPLRTSSVRFMRRWLLDKDDAVTEPPFEPLTGDDVLVTPRGQAQLLTGAKSVMDFNLEAAEAAAEHRRELWKPENREKALAAVRKRIGIRPVNEIRLPKIETYDVVDRDGMSIGKHCILPDNGIPLPFLSINPVRPTEPNVIRIVEHAERTVLYLHAEGKQVDVTVDGPIAKLVAKGARVYAFDVRGCGETGNNSFYDAFVTYLLGRSVVGGRVEDCLSVIKFLRESEPSEDDQLELVAVGSMTVPALHVAALEPKLFRKVTLRGGLKSWVDVVRNPLLPGQLINVVHGALLDYDLTDLANSLPPGTVKIEDPLE